MLTTALSLMLATNLVLQGNEFKQDNVVWGIYYNDHDVTCNLMSTQDGITFNLRRDANNKVELVLSSPDWNFTQNKRIRLGTTFKSNNKETTTLLPYQYSAQNPNEFALKADASNFLVVDIKVFSVMFNAKSKLQFNTHGIVAMRQEFDQCQLNLVNINVDCIVTGKQIGRAHV